MTPEQIASGFSRYRRFLIAVSVAMTFVTLLDLDFEKVSLLGNEATIRNPSRVILIGWFIWAWAIVQYVLWYRDIGAWAQIRAATRIDCNSRLQLLMVKRPVPNWLESSLMTTLRQTAGSNFELEKITLHVEGARDIDPIGPQKIIAVHMFASATSRLPDQRGEIKAGPARYEADVTPEEFSQCNRRAWLSVLFTRSYVFEYLAPFAIGVLPIAVLFWSKFQGDPPSGIWI